MTHLKYIRGYPPELLEDVERLIERDELGAMLAKRYTFEHEIQSDHALYDYTQALKRRYMKSAQPLSKVIYDGNLDRVQKALGLHVRARHKQGSKVKKKTEIRIASVFKEAAPEFLRAIVVHELAHLRELEHNKSFYRLCQHMEPDYHQLEFDLRLWLTWRELSSA